MKGFRVLATAWVFGLAMTAAAQAADMPGSWLPDIKKPFYTDLISGWYFRGDAGYRMNSIGRSGCPAARLHNVVEHAERRGRSVSAVATNTSGSAPT